jgi:hypothetical protein
MAPQVNEPVIVCPKCKTGIPLTASLAAPVVEAARRKFENQLAKERAELLDREEALRKQQAAVEAAQRTIDSQVASRLKTRETAIAAEEKRKARLALESDLATRDRTITDLACTVDELNKKLTVAMGVEVECRRKERALDEKMREADVLVERRVSEGVATGELKVRQRIEAEASLKLAEKDKLLADAHRQLEEMQRRIQQGSQQLQGEVQELELEAILRARFPQDQFEPVPKGEFGGDALQRVVGPSGMKCGTIIWEFKRTKNWSDAWLAKLRSDQRTANAELAVIVSTALPKDIDAFDHVDGIWITSPRCVVAVALALRHLLIEVTATRLSGENQQTKMELIYQYLTGARFRHRIQAIVERVTDMHDDLDRERKTMVRLWAKREEQIRQVIESTAGMYGDLQGIAGRTMQEIEGLSPLALPDPGRSSLTTSSGVAS